LHRQQLDHRRARRPLRVLHARLMAEPAVRRRRSSRWPEEDRHRHRGGGGERRYSLRRQLGAMVPADAGDERQMVVGAPSRVAAFPPLADVAVFDGFRIVCLLNVCRIARDELEESASGQPVVRRIFGDAMTVNHMMRRLVRRCDDVKGFRRHALHGCEEIGVESELQDRPATRLARQLRIVCLVRPGPQCARALDATQHVGVAVPSSAAERRLDDDVYASRERRHRLGRRIGRVREVDDLQMLCAQPVDESALMLPALLLQGKDESVGAVRSDQVAVRDGHVEADAVAAGEEIREVGRGEA
jgi:hypothetical protein